MLSVLAPRFALRAAPRFAPRFGTRACSVALPPLSHEPEEVQMFREATRKWCEEVMAPKVRPMEEAARIDPEVLSGLFENGFLGVEIDEAFGGAQGSFTAACVVVEEIARVDPAVALLVDIQNTLVNTIMRKYGTTEQKELWLPRLAQDTVGCFALSEAGSGSDAFAMKTAAKADGDDFVLNGTKLWISNAREAGFFIVFANADFSKGYKGITAFAVDATLPGVTIGKKEEKLGLHASATCEVLLENVRVPKSAIIGKYGEGYKIAIGCLNEGRIGIGAQMLGLARGAMDSTIPYLKQREQFGRPVVDFQAMRHQIAESEMQLHAARLMVYEAARMHENGLDIQTEGAMAKYFASQVAVETSKRCVQWLGGVGYTREFMAEKFYRDSIIGTIYEGTNNMMLETIGKQILKRYD